MPAEIYAQRLLEAALGYAAIGWHVFPCYEPKARHDGDGCTCSLGSQCRDVGKHPRTKEGLKEATVEEAKIRAWWKTWPFANIGVRTGEISGFFVCDFDPKHGGLDLLATLEKSYGALPHTIKARTGDWKGERGIHVMLRTAGEKIPSRAGLLGKGGDTRGEGGYIIAPPSWHVSRVQYEWEVDPVAGLALAPDWLLALIDLSSKKPEPSPPPSGSRTNGQHRVHTHEEKVKRCQAYVDRIPGAADGERSDKCYREVCPACRGFDLGEEEFVPILMSWVHRCDAGSHPFDEREARKTLASFESRNTYPPGWLLEQESESYRARTQSRHDDAPWIDDWVGPPKDDPPPFGEDDWAALGATERERPSGEHESETGDVGSGPAVWGFEDLEPLELAGEPGLQTEVVGDPGTRPRAVKPPKNGKNGHGKNGANGHGGTNGTKPHGDEKKRKKRSPIWAEAEGVGREEPDDGNIRERHLVDFKLVDRGPDGFPLTQLGNGQRVIRDHGKDIRYCAKLQGPRDRGRGWIYWVGTHWRHDEEDAVIEMAGKTFRSMWSQALRIADDDERSKWLSWCHKSEDLTCAEKSVRWAGKQTALKVKTEELDSHEFLVNTQTGVVDVRSLEIGRHSREDYITKITRYGYDKDAKCPLWDGFLKKITGGDEELEKYLQRAIGYSITGSIREQCVFLLYGTGSNGKSTMLQTIKSIFYDYGHVVDFSSFTESKNDKASNDIAALHGARYVFASEPRHTRLLDEALLKKLSGSEEVTARFLFGEFFSFMPQFKLWLSANRKPKIRGTDEGIWRRLRLIPFTVEIPDSEKDLDFPHKLQAEHAGILRWVIDGANVWTLGGLRTPQKILDATKEYREEMDVLGAFVESCCFVGEMFSANASLLYDAYKKWALEQSEYVMAQKDFRLQMIDKGYEYIKRNKANVVRGVGLQDDHTDDDKKDKPRRYGGDVDDGRN